MSMATDTPGRTRSTLADIRQAQLRAMQAGNRALVITLELIAMHRRFEEQGMFKDGGQQESSEKTKP